ncbi:mechanosensitive ion channel family protein [Spirosoma pollinicola]|uniref:Uncharacterized protein n=1 Tax=Spirosoma pollinicola TaxID=2057025 RepID=A0A2K8Z0E0_9BACT|nr:hypothetical protein [Spirosoma pollinicola]AUD03360.1 hypothetical protein CWM47_16875 [Spirosoma pollinicola]
MNIVDVITSSLTGFFEQLAAFFPRLIGAFILLLIGSLIARGVRFLVTKVLKAIRFDAFAAQVGVDGFLQRGGIQQPPSAVMGTMLYWLIMLVVYQTFFNSLGLEVVSTLLSSVILYIPNVIVSTIIIVVGLYLADFVKSMLVATLRSTGVQYADLIGTIVRVAILFLVFSIALTQLKVGEAIINTVVSVVLGAAGLALSIAFGFGAREWATDLINRYLRSQDKV